MLEWRRFWRARGEGRAIRSRGGVDGVKLRQRFSTRFERKMPSSTYIVVGQQVEGAENFVVLELEASGIFVVLCVGIGRRVVCHFFWASLCFEHLLPVGVLSSGDARSSATAVVVVWVRRVRLHGAWVVLCRVVVSRHC